MLINQTMEPRMQPTEGCNCWCKDILSALRTMRQEWHLCDVMLFASDNTSFTAHSILLAASSNVFSAHLVHHKDTFLQELSDRNYLLSGMGPDILEVTLNFVYGIYPTNHEERDKLGQGADILDIIGAKTYLKKFEKLDKGASHVQSGALSVEHVGQIQTDLNDTNYLHSEAQEVKVKHDPDAVFTSSVNTSKTENLSPRTVSPAKGRLRSPQTELQPNTKEKLAQSRNKRKNTPHKVRQVSSKRRKVKRVVTEPDTEISKPQLPVVDHNDNSDEPGMAENDEDDAWYPQQTQKRKATKKGPRPKLKSITNGKRRGRKPGVKNNVKKSGQGQKRGRKKIIPEPEALEHADVSEEEWVVLDPEEIAENSSGSSTPSKSESGKGHRRVKLFECEATGCPYKNKFWDWMQSHMYHRHGIGEPEVPCFLCDKKYFSNNQLQVHMKRAHQKAEKKVQESLCPDCGAVYISPSAMRTHMLKEHGKGKVFTCDDCEFKSPRKKDMQAHMVAQHSKAPPGVRVYVCPHCNYKCVDRKRYEEHEAKHTGIQKYLCPLCGKGYTTRRGMNTHVKYHSDERPYKCAICDASFKQRGKLNDHMRLVHTQRGLKPFECYYCNHATALRGNCNQHIKKSHPGLPVIVIDTLAGERKSHREYIYTTVSGEQVEEVHDATAASYASIGNAANNIPPVDGAVLAQDSIAADSSQDQVNLPESSVITQAGSAVNTRTDHYAGPGDNLGTVDATCIATAHSVQTEMASLGMVTPVAVPQLTQALSHGGNEEGSVSSLCPQTVAIPGSVPGVLLGAGLNAPQAVPSLHVNQMQPLVSSSSELTPLTNSTGSFNMAHDGIHQAVPNFDSGDLGRHEFRQHIVSESGSSDIGQLGLGQSDHHSHTGVDNIHLGTNIPDTH